MSNSEAEKQNNVPVAEQAGEELTESGDTPASGLDLEVEQLKQQSEEARKSAESLRDQLLRKAAEFENYKRRTESDFANVIRNATEGLILQLLPILNDFGRSLKSGQASKDFDAFYKGVELIHNKFSRLLEGQGLQPFDSVGQPFDVEYHDALMQMPRKDVPPHTVIEEVERGYKLNDRVLRHAKVVVSAQPSEEATGDDAASAPNGGEAN